VFVFLAKIQFIYHCFPVCTTLGSCCIPLKLGRQTVDLTADDASLFWSCKRCFPSLWCAFCLNRRIFNLTVAVVPSITLLFYVCFFENLWIFDSVAVMKTLWLNLDPLIHQTVQIYPMLSLFSFISFYYFFYLFTLLFLFTYIILLSRFFIS